MALAAFLVVCGGGFLLGLLVRPSGGLARLVSIFGLAAAFGAALLIGSSEAVTAGAVTAGGGTGGAVPAGVVTIGDVKLVGGAYVGVFLACGTGTGLRVCVVGLGTGW